MTSTARVSIKVPKSSFESAIERHPERIRINDRTFNIISPVVSIVIGETEIEPGADARWTMTDISEYHVAGSLYAFTAEVTGRLNRALGTTEQDIFPTLTTRDTITEQDSGLLAAEVDLFLGDWAGICDDIVGWAEHLGIPSLGWAEPQVAPMLAMINNPYTRI